MPALDVIKCLEQVEYQSFYHGTYIFVRHLYMYMQLICSSSRSTGPCSQRCWTLARPSCPWRRSPTAALSTTSPSRALHPTPPTTLYSCAGWAPRSTWRCTTARRSRADGRWWTSGSIWAGPSTTFATAAPGTGSSRGSPGTDSGPSADRYSLFLYIFKSHEKNIEYLLIVIDYTYSCKTTVNQTPYRGHICPLYRVVCVLDNLDYVWYH